MQVLVPNDASMQNAAPQWVLLKQLPNKAELRNRELYHGKAYKGCQKFGQNCMHLAGGDAHLTRSPDGVAGPRVAGQPKLGWFGEQITMALSYNSTSS